MRLLLALILLLPALAQEPPAQTKPEEKPAQAQTAPPQTPPAKPEQKPAEEPAKAEEKAAAENPTPPTEQWLSGSIDFGFRWLTDVKGNFNQYRSVVDERQGPGLFGVDFTIQDPKKRLFDRIDAQAYDWGGEPYNTARIAARKLGIYDFRFDYRNIAYFNAIPSYANPSAPAGFNEQSFDIRRRTLSAALDIFPGKRIIPYLAFERNSAHGNGIETWVLGATDEFPVPRLITDRMNNYRGGVRFEYNLFQVTLEQGGTTYGNDDQGSWNGINYGDRTTTALGQMLFLSSLSQAYSITGSSIYEKVLVTAHPLPWADLYGQFLFSQPKTDARYTDTAAGQFANVSALLLYNGQSDLAVSSAKQPHSTGNVGFVLRPFSRLRVIESFLTDRFHDAASAVVTQQILLGGAGTNQNINSALSYGQFVNYNQQQLDVLFDLTSKLTLRGGFRYLWGDAQVLSGTLNPAGNTVSGELRRSVGLAGLNYRPMQKLTLNLDYEGASSDQVYFRTSLNDYSRARARARYQATPSLSLQANFQVLDNQNPSPAIRYDFRSRQNSLAIWWTPAGGKRVSLMAEYDRSTLRSDISYLGLFFVPAVSSYRDNAHTATSAVDVTLPWIHGLPAAKFTAGGSLFISSGSRPTDYYQPLARVSLPIQKHVYWNTEWRYYGFGEDFYSYEAFRTHLFQTGIRLTR
jgi:hypothetical protein